MKQKQCFVCHAVKTLDQFPKHKKMGDGHLNECRDCHLRKQREHYRRKRQDPEWLEKELARTRLKERRRRADGLVIRTSRPDCKKYIAKYPEKRRAVNLVNNALRAGKIQKLPCAICGNTKSEAHHDDYSKPLDVIWLCQPHHSERHVLLRQQQRAARKLP